MRETVRLLQLRVMSRLTSLLLLVLVCSRSLSNANLIRAIDVAKHPTIGVAGAKKPDNRFSHAASHAERDDRDEV